MPDSPTSPSTALTPLDRAALQDRLDRLLVEYDVPGAAVGVAVGEEMVVCVSGVAKRPAGPHITPETLFLIASVTKPWTATMVMQLVDEGRVDLDDPVNHYLDPPLRLADQAVADEVTVRQLLSHTGGFFGDAEEPAGDGDDAVRRTVEGYATLAQLHRPGALFSYSNAGYNVLGRLIECLDGTTWDESLHQRLVGPLQLEHTSTRIERTATHPLAVGHEPVAPDSLELEPVDVWMDPRGSGPCGGTLATSAADLLRFGLMHARDGRGPRGQVLSAESARTMRRPEVVQPDPGESPAWSLGWAVARAESPVVIEHGGNTCGQHSQLVVVPDHELAICVLANGDTQGQLREALVAPLLGDLAGAGWPTVPEASETVGDPDPAVIGRYRRSEEVTILVDSADEGLEITFETSGETAGKVPTFSSALRPVGGETYVFHWPPLTIPITATFVSENGAPASHVAIGLRVAPRLSPVAAP